MFPNKQEIEFFKEAKRIQELWEPKFGDMTWNQNLRRCLILYPAAGEYVRIWSDLTVDQQVHKQYLVWLPRQGQLQEMLEERGYNTKILTLVLDQSEYKTKVTAWPYKGRLIKTFGPTPSIALGRALIEVLKEE